MSSCPTSEDSSAPASPDAASTASSEVRGSRNILLLWLGHLISTFGDWALWIAIPITVYRRTNSTVDLAFTYVTEGLPLLLAPFAGVMVDRWDRRRTMIAADIGRAVMVSALLFPRGPVPLWLCYVVLLVNSTLSLFFAPARMAFVTQIVTRRQFMRTNALLSTSTQITEWLGPVVGALILTRFLQRGSFLLDCASFLVSAVCIALATGMPRIAPTKRSAPGFSGMIADLKEGMILIARTPVVRALVTMGPLIYVITTIFNAPEYAFASKYLHATQNQYGTLLSAAGLGVFVGGLAIVTLLHKFRPLHLLIAGLIMAAAGGVGYGLSPNYLWALVPHFFLGLGGILASIPIATLIQTSVPSDMLGRVFGAWSIFTRGAQVLSGIAAGFLAAAIPIPRLYVGNAFLFLVLVVMALLLLKPALAANSVALATEDRGEKASGD